LVKTVRGSAVEAFYEVAVAVHGDLDGGVSETGLDGLSMFAGTPGDVYL